MLAYRDYTQTPETLKGCVLAIGNFDGLHRGHRRVIDQALNLAKHHNKPCIILTFHPHPRRYFSGDSGPLPIEPFHMKLRRLRALGCDAVLTLPFNKKLAQLSAQDFVDDILVKHLAVTHVVVGEDFHFGHKRSGDVSFLQQCSLQHHFGFSNMPPATDNERTISSTYIRSLISLGDVKKAAILLGRPYQLYGRVIHGDKRGRTIGVPTANIALSQLHHPAYGVYAVQYALLDSPNCKTHPPEWKHGVANVGVRPTFGINDPLLEVHALGDMEPAYGRFMRVRMIEHIRSEQKFDTMDALKLQISRDIQSAQNILNHYENIDHKGTKT